MKYHEMEPMKYWAMPPSMDRQTRKNYIEKMINSGDYIFSRKYDGNWARAVITSEKQALQTRGISKVSGTYGEIQDKVFFWEDICNSFTKDTVFLGEVYLNGGIDKDVGSITRCLSQKAKSIQDENFYKEICKTYKFSAKDRRDIEGNSFKNQKLSFRVFDVLVYEGLDLMNSPIEERIKYIEKVVKQINNPLVRGLKYFEMDENFFEQLARIFADDGEGVVCYKKNSLYIPGKRGPHSWDTVKIKQEISQDIDCFIYGIEPAVRDYTGKEIENWKFWQDIKTDEKLFGEYFSKYRLGTTNLEPISKGYYYGWPGAIYCAVWDENHEPIILCKCAGLTEEFKEELKNNYDNYHMMPIKITGMMVSGDNSIRHPKLVSIRDNDISVDDCTLSKIKG